MSGQKPKKRLKKGQTLYKVSSALGVYGAFLVEGGWEPDGAGGAVRIDQKWTSSGKPAAVGHTWARPPGSEAAYWIRVPDQKQPPAEATSRRPRVRTKQTSRRNGPKTTRKE